MACPVHKKAFSLESGKCLSGEEYAVKVFPGEGRRRRVYVQVPIAKMKAAEAACCVRSASFRGNRGGEWHNHVWCPDPSAPVRRVFLAAAAVRPICAAAGGRILDHRNAVEEAAGNGRRAFSRAHFEGTAPACRARFYRDLIPLNSPKEGEQYAFEVDLDSCTGCKSCVAACHNLNGLDEDELWRKVGLLSGGSSQHPVIQHISTACHHCVEPACMEGCPVLAYEKDPITGIVVHLDDQCIGCQYCVLKCPYDVPRYSKKMGIVRKCDMCSSRLAVGEAPACVQACPEKAIRITVVNKEAVSAKAAANLFLPGAPEPGYTKPATIYKTQKKLPANLLPADYWSVSPQHSHLPLVFMLVLTQMSAGAFLVERILACSLPARHGGSGDGAFTSRTSSPRW